MRRTATLEARTATTTLGGVGQEVVHQTRPLGFEVL